MRKSTICDNMDGLWKHYVKWNKSDKVKYCMILLICVIKQNRTKHKIYRKIDPMYGYQRQVVRMGGLKEDDQKIRTSVVR